MKGWPKNVSRTGSLWPGCRLPNSGIMSKIFNIQHNSCRYSVVKLWPYNTICYETEQSKTANRPQRDSTAGRKAAATTTTTNVAVIICSKPADHPIGVVVSEFSVFMTGYLYGSDVKAIQTKSTEGVILLSTIAAAAAAAAATATTTTTTITTTTTTTTTTYGFCFSNLLFRSHSTLTGYLEGLWKENLCNC